MDSSFLLQYIMLGLPLGIAMPMLFYKHLKLYNYVATLIPTVFFAIIVYVTYLFFRGINFQYILYRFSSKYLLAFQTEFLGIIFVSLISFLWPLASIYTIKFAKLNQFHRSYFFVLFVNLCVFMGIWIAFAANLFTMFVGYEILTFFTIPLIMYNNESTSTYKNIYFYICSLQLSSICLFLPAIVITYYLTGTGSFLEYRAYHKILGDVVSNIEGKILVAMFIFGIAKSTIFPISYWLIKTMIASYPISSLLHSVIVVKVGLFCTYKIFFYVFGFEYLYYLFKNLNWIILFPAFGVIFFSISAVKAHAIKTILAYSTISNLNISLLSAFLFTEKGFLGALLHFVSHSFTKIVMFYSAGNIFSICRNIYFIKTLIGVNKILPITSFLFLISSLSLIGIPPLGGFFSKYSIISAAIDQKSYIVIFAISVSSICSVIFLFKILLFIYKNVNTHLIIRSIKPKFQDLYHKSGKFAYLTEIRMSLFILVSMFICVVGNFMFFYVKIFIQNLVKF